MIEVRHLAKSFAVAARARRARGQRDRGSEAALAERDGERRIHAVRDVSFDAPNGSITGLLGPERRRQDDDTAHAGCAHHARRRIDAGRRDRRRRHPREVLARMGVLSDARGLYPRLTARENIVYYGACTAWSATLPTHAPRSSPACSR
jgi:sodium transport system ATP-binding protein